MSNPCFYIMKAVSKDEEALKRLIKIMHYDDPEYVIYRCFVADCNGVKKDGEWFVADIQGEVAWACTNWFNCEEDKSNVNSDCGGHYITLDLLCKKLGIGIELYSEEDSCGFQEHYLCNGEGVVVIDDSVEWSHEYEDEDGNEYDEPKEIGGYASWDFGTPEEIYNKSK